MNVRWVCRALRAQACRLGKPNLHSTAKRPGAVAVAGLAQEESLQAWRRRQKVVVVTGPTAVGKTNVSLALAERLNGEIYQRRLRAGLQGPRCWLRQGELQQVRPGVTALDIQRCCQTLSNLSWDCHCGTATVNKQHGAVLAHRFLWKHGELWCTT